MNAPSLEPTTAPPAPATADPDVFFAATSALRALRHLEQAIAQDDRLVVLTGDEGVGKTTVVQRLLHGLDQRAIWGVLLSATHLDTGELPGSLARAFGAAAAAATPAALLAALRRHLASHAEGRSALAVVDDAHALTPQAIATLAELTREGTLHVLLVGQPALRTILARQLPLQPASLSCHLEPLTESETPAYIEHRLRRIGWTGTPEFSAEALSLIHRFSRGVPLRIDRLCDRLLRAARRRTEPTIGAEEVRRIARPRRDENAIPMLTSTIDEPLASGWGASTDLPPETGPAPWARAPAPPDAPKRPDTGGSPRPSAMSAVRERRIGLVVAAAVLTAAAALGAWRWLAPAPVDASMTTATPPPTALPAEPAPEPTTPAADTATITPPPPAPIETARPAAPPARVAPTTPPPSRDGTPLAAPPAVPGPCTATVAALGLCTPTEAPP